MKLIITLFTLFLTMFNYAQTDKLNTVISLENVKLKDFSVSVTVDSAEDIESTFKVTD